MKAKLIVVGGDAKAAEIKLRLPTVIGRGREASLTLPHPLVSRQHCEIYEDSGRLCVRDLGSLNGTFVNNQKIEQATEVPSGDLLTIGTVTFRAVYDIVADELPPPASEPAAAIDAAPAPGLETVSADQAQAPPAVDPIDSGVDDDLIDDIDAFEEVSEDPETPPTAKPVAVPAATPVAVAAPAQVPDTAKAGLDDDDDFADEVVEDFGETDDPVGLDDVEEDDMDFLENELDTVEADEAVANDLPLTETIDVPSPKADKKTKPDDGDDDSLDAFFKGLR